MSTSRNRLPSAPHSASALRATSNAWRRLRWVIWVALVCILVTGGQGRTVLAQEPEAPDAEARSPYSEAAQEQWEQMSVAERVGQLFLVTFEGDSAEIGTDIADLVLNFHVGGVALAASNGNIRNAAQVAQLNEQLQRLALGDPITADPDFALTAETFQLVQESGAPIPLLIAVQHEGDGFPHTQIVEGLTPIPNEMALGATWDPAFARLVGDIVGRELSTIGVNMLLGPSLDVLESPAPGTTSDLGTRTFGGDPYWVSVLGQAYVDGVKEGSDARMAVIAKHFPGYGGSDRATNLEIATVRKSLTELEQIDLVPFFAVTDPEPDSVAVDGLLTTHIRYQGLSGNIRATTAPVSFSPSAQAALMALPQFAEWRGNGGLIVSDALGVEAVQRFYDDTGQSFPHRQVAKDAFAAGNDLLYLAEFALGASDSSAEAQTVNIKDTIRWFQERYDNEPSFQQRVDAAGVRILELKLKLYGNDQRMDRVLPNSAELPDILATNQALLLDMPANAISLLAPNPDAFPDRFPAPPAEGESIVIFTDVRTSQQCTDCPEQAWIGLDTLEESLLTLYGPQASNQIDPEQVQSFSFADLNAFLSAGRTPIVLPTLTPTATPEPDATPTEPPPPNATPTATPLPPADFRVQEALRDVDWIVFALLDVTSESAESNALNNFLDQRPDLARSANVVVFAYNAPYFLDATDVSKLSIYFGVYSKIQSFIDTSIQALFQDVPVLGRSPVNVEGVGYDLFEATQPDPVQRIPLFIVQDGDLFAPSSDEPIEQEGEDALVVQTGVIVDTNGNPVPDGTIVRFLQEDLFENQLNVVTERPTENGVAQLTFVLPEGISGRFRITASTGDVTRSDEVNIIGNQASIATPTPEPTATATPAPPTATATPTQLPPTPTPTPTPLPIPTEPQEPTLNIALSDIVRLLGVFAGVALVGVSSYMLGTRWVAERAAQVRLILWGVIGGLLLYNYVALGLPGASLLAGLAEWGGLVALLIGGAAGVGLYAWRIRPKTTPSTP